MKNLSYLTTKFLSTIWRIGLFYLITINICFASRKSDYIVCETVKDMVNLPSESLNSNLKKGVRLKGYYKRGDFGEPLVFTWDQESDGIEDGGSIFKLNGVSKGRLIHEYQYVDVRHFGIKSGVDCSLRFQQLLKYAFKNGLVITSPDFFNFVVSRQLYSGGNVKKVCFSLGKSNSLKVVSKRNIDQIIHVESSDDPYDVECNFSNLRVDCNRLSNGFLLLVNFNKNISHQVRINDLTILNSLKSLEYNNAAWALGIRGAFADVFIKNVTVDNVNFDPRSIYGAEAKGIVVTDFEGTAIFENCTVKRVQTQTGIDADGFAVFSKYTDRTLTKGRAIFLNCKGYDNQGRHIKSQCSNTIVNGGYFERKNIRVIQQSVDFDFQAGNGTIQNVNISYKFGDDGTSPLSSSFMTVAAQNLQTDKIKTTRINNIKIDTEVIIPKVIHLFNNFGLTTVLIDDLKIYSTLKSVIGRSFCEFNADEISEGKLKVKLMNCKFNSSVPFIGYSSSQARNLNRMLDITLQNNETGPYSKVLHKLSGKDIQGFTFRLL